MALNSPFTEILYIDLPPLLLWSSLPKLSEMLPPGLGCSPHFALIKLNLKLSSCASFIVTVFNIQENVTFLFFNDFLPLISSLSLFFFFFFATPEGMQDHNSPARDGTVTLQ